MGSHLQNLHSQATTRTGRHPHRHAASACHAGVFVYISLLWVVSFSLCCSEHRTTLLGSYQDIRLQTLDRPCGLEQAG